MREYRDSGRDSGRGRGGGRDGGRDSGRDGGMLPHCYQIFHGEVANVTAYGAFVKIPGCRKQGLVHKSQMSSARVEDPSEMVARGEKVYCKVISMESDGEKISLSMKVVNQTTGRDLDPNNVQSSQDEKKRRQWKIRGANKIEIGADVNTTCRRCGGHGHFAMDCYARKGHNNEYDLLPDLDKLTDLRYHEEESTKSGHRKKKKKDKKGSGEKKARKRRHSSSSSPEHGSSNSDQDRKKVKKHGENRRKSGDSRGRRNTRSVSPDGSGSEQGETGGKRFVFSHEDERKPSMGSSSEVWRSEGGKRSRKRYEDHTQESDEDRGGGGGGGGNRNYPRSPNLWGGHRGRDSSDHRRAGDGESDEEYKLRKSKSKKSSHGDRGSRFVDSENNGREADSYDMDRANHRDKGGNSSREVLGHKGEHPYHRKEKRRKDKHKNKDSDSSPLQVSPDRNRLAHERKVLGRPEKERKAKQYSDDSESE